ncbi:MAG: hypothetical protein COV67_06040 [Nitrospinae bacterium CG11_big_fil_rev_8_21_14_0_20_56_8]|nr:MAG: hypothetical protein COV67_06040 [Nitrospinae bacterium CG11_big_fil_rev_8_21_14_0_20_56_8]
MQTLGQPQAEFTIFSGAFNKYQYLNGFQKKKEEMNIFGIKKTEKLGNGIPMGGPPLPKGGSFRESLRAGSG